MLNLSLLFSLFSYPHRCYFCLSSKTFNELSSVSSSYSDNSQGPPHDLPHKSTASSFHWEMPYSPTSLLTVYNLFIFRSWAFSNMSFSCWLQQKNTPAWGIPNNIIRSLIGNWFFLKKLSRPLRSACICQSPVVPIIYLKLLFLKFQRYMYLKYNLMKWLVGLGFDSWFGCDRSGV